MMKYLLSFDIKILSYCNMNCNYCISHDNKNEILTHDEIISYIKLVYKKVNLDTKINVVLLGGEVTILPKGYLKNLVYELNKLNIGRINIYTNLKIFSKELKEIYLSNKNTYLNISYDTIDDLLSDRTITFNEVKNNLLKYEDMSRIIIHSVLNNITSEIYSNLIDVFNNIGVNIFRFKFERNLGSYLYKFKLYEKFLSFFQENIVDKYKTLDIKFITNMIMNTVISNEVKFKNNLSIMYQVHILDKKSERMMRNTFFDIKLKEKQKFNLYE